MKRFTLPLAAVLFFLSGALGLGYELVWVHKAALVVGASQIALATVLTSFFLGLGVGSLVVGRRLRSARWSPLFVYGLFEAAIGVFALLFPLLFGGFEAVYGAVYPALQGSWLALFLLRFGLLFVLFLIPTFFMGGTLPLLLDGLVAQDESVGSYTSLLYGVNILGAVAGVLLTCYVAIPELGMNTTSRVGGLGNLAIAAVALLAFKRLLPLRAPAPEGEQAVRGPERFFLVCCFASGLAAIGYQIAWARYFTLFNTNSVYLTAILLAVFLAALATGSLVLAPLLHRRARPLRVVGILQPLVPVLVLYGLGWWQLAEYTWEPVGDPQAFVYAPSWSLAGETVDATFFAPLFQVALVIFLPVALLGTGLPALIAAATPSHGDLRRVSGTLVFSNGLGSSAGGFLTGYVLLAVIGLQGTLFALGLVSLALGAAAEWKLAPQGDRGLDRLRPGYLLAGLLLLPCLLFLRQDITTDTIRQHGYGGMPLARSDELVEVYEGPLTTAFVFDGPDRISLGAGNVCLAVSNKRVPSSQAIQGHLPILFFPGDDLPHSTLGICLGSGQSFGAALMYDVGRLDVVDISGEIVDLSLKYFGDVNHGLGEDERVTFHLDDGRHFVERAPDADYDVVSIEPPPPTAEGVYSLYSLEFYQQVSRVLREPGVFLQWLPLYRITPRDALGIIRTQMEVFPHTFLVKMGTIDFVVLSFKGSAPRFSVDQLRIRARTFARERMIAGRRWHPGCRYDIASLEGILSLVIAGPEDLSELEGEVYRDDTQRLSYSSGDRELLRRYEGSPLARLSFAALPRTPFARLAAFFDQPLKAEVLDRERARSLGYFKVPDPAQLAEARSKYEALPDSTERARVALGIAASYDGWLGKEDALGWVERALQSDVGVEDEALARRIARHGVGVYGIRLREWLSDQQSRFSDAPVLQAMDAELTGFGY